MIFIPSGEAIGGLTISIIAVKIYEFINELKKSKGERNFNNSFGETILIIMGEFFISWFLFLCYSFPSSQLNFQTCASIGLGCMYIFEKQLKESRKAEKEIKEKDSIID